MGTAAGKSGWWLDVETFQSLGIDSESVMGLLGESLGAGGCTVRRQQCLDFIATHTSTVLEATNFVSAPTSAVLAMLELDVLAADELSLWRGVLSWAVMRADLLTDSPVWWTPPERARILPLLRPALRPGRLRLLDLDPVVFARDVERTGAVDEEELIFKYRFEALKADVRHQRDCDEREAVLLVVETYYSRKRDVLGKYGPDEMMKRVRRKAIILESEHPHETGTDGQDTRVVEGPNWATHMIMEFDPRTEIGPTAKLSFHYKLKNGEDCSKTYASPFPRRASPSEVYIHAPRVVVSFSSDADCKPGWGYRIRFTPVAFASDDS